jgi:hypothetical protein
MVCMNYTVVDREIERRVELSSVLFVLLGVCHLLD